MLYGGEPQSYFAEGFNLVFVVFLSKIREAICADFLH